MLQSKFLVLAILGIIPIAIGCTDQTTPPKSTSSPAASLGLSASPAPSSPSADTIAPGRYCYRADQQTVTAAMRLTVAPDQTITGDSRATIHNESEGYYSSYAQEISGSVAGDQLTAKIRTTIENDVQDTQEVWSITSSEVITPQLELIAANCEEVQSSFTE